jgi:hypothetical protein
MLVINIILYGLGAHMFFSLVCPNKYHIALLNLSFYIILTYSYMEMYAKKIYYHPSMHQIRAFIKNANKKSELEIVKFNEVVLTNRDTVHVHDLILCNFIIFSDYNDSNLSSQKVNKILYFGIEDFPFTYTYNVCKFSFISFNVKLIVNCKEKSYPIKLSDTSENYYVIGNKINRLLICYLLKKQHGVICDESKEKYVLELIDQDVNMITLTEKDEIILNEKNYKVSPFVFNDASNMTIKDIEKMCNRCPRFDGSATCPDINNPSINS